MRWGRLAGAVALGLLSLGILGLWGETAVKQPIEFPHKTHAEMNLACTSCHERAEKEVVAGLPPKDLCLSCHSGGEATGEIKKLQAFERGGELPWRRECRLPPQVFFAHGTHVTTATLQCQRCHGPMETLDRPPSRPLRSLTMDDCLECHERQPQAAGAPTGGKAMAAARPALTDCLACHR
jgi:hypothetical protein